MTKTRVGLFLFTILFVSTVGYIISHFARGYKFDPKKLNFTPRGLLIIKSDPDGAQIFINGDLKTATNANLSLAPETYDITLKKDGYNSWNKKLAIDKEVVTEIDAHLFKNTPSLSPVTFSSTINPVSSPDFSKIAFFVPATIENIDQEKEGLWIIETINLPLGFARDPKRVTGGNLADANWQWSPDGREILLTTPTGNYLLEVGVFTPQNKRINITSTLDSLYEKWELELDKRQKAQLRGLAKEMIDILERKTSFILFSPDETKILYKAIDDATIPDNLIPTVPGASSQKQERNIKAGRIYVYDIKEDRNFFILESEALDKECKLNTPSLIVSCSSTLVWFPTSRNLVLTQNGKISIMDYDGTNNQEVYSGSFIGPVVYPTASIDRMIILTNLGADSTPPNLYSISLK
jgi:hypothetical protein